MRAKWQPFFLLTKLLYYISKNGGSSSPTNSMIRLAYQSWYSIFLSQQNNISRLISRKNH
jgi:hypothetical protein